MKTVIRKYTHLSASLIQHEHHGNNSSDICIIQHVYHSSNPSDICILMPYAS